VLIKYTYSAAMHAFERPTEKRLAQPNLRDATSATFLYAIPVPLIRGIAAPRTRGILIVAPAR
jgi:hypothetical protein